MGIACVSVIVQSPAGVLMVDHLGLKYKGKKLRAWAFPGGKHEGSESYRRTAQRELYEETGVSVVADHLQYLGLVFLEPYDAYFYSIRMENIPEVKVKEPKKHADVGWFAWDNMPWPISPLDMKFLFFGLSRYIKLLI